MLNDDTLKQFFIQGFFKVGTIREVLEKKPQTLAEVKMAARDMKNIDKEYDRLWKKEYESIPQFIPIRPRAIKGELCRHRGRALYSLIESILQTREPTYVLALPAPTVDPNLAEVEKN